MPAAEGGLGWAPGGERGQPWGSPLTHPHLSPDTVTGPRWPAAGPASAGLWPQPRF